IVFCCKLRLHFVYSRSARRDSDHHRFYPVHRLKKFLVSHPSDSNCLEGILSRALLLSLHSTFAVRTALLERGMIVFNSGLVVLAAVTDSPPLAHSRVVIVQLPAATLYPYTNAAR